MIIHARTWKDMSLDPTITEKQRAMLAVWDYPVSDKWTRIWQEVLNRDEGAPESIQDALDLVRDEDKPFAWLGEMR